MKGNRGMLLGYNGLTTRDSTLEEDIVFSSRQGFDVVELRDYKIAEYLKHNTMQDIKKLLEDSDIIAIAINSLEIMATTFRQSDSFFEKFNWICEVADAISSPYIVVAPMVNEYNLPKSEIDAQLIELFRKMSDTVPQKSSIKIGLEHIGLLNAQVKNLDEAVTLLKCIDRVNVGLVIDTFAFYASNSKIEDIAKVDKNDLLMVHLNDSKIAYGQELFQECFRTYPGEGVIPIDKILNEFKKIGFDGAFTVELIDPKVWAEDTEKVIEKSYSSLRKVLNDSFFSL